MQIGILGPLTVVGTDGPVAVGGARLRTLLLRLAVDAGTTVHTDRLVDALWGERVPADQANALQSLVSRLRRVLAEPVLQSTPAGYRLAVGPDDVDATRFERLAREGRAALERGAPAEAAQLLEEALGLWRGQPLEDVADAPFAATAVHRLHELRLAATEDRLDAELALGHATAVVAEVEPLAAAHPLRERLRGLQVRALGAAGRQAEALSTYDDIRRRLADELGVDPSPALQEAQLAVLRGETAGAAPREVATNLRAALTTFVGRDADEAAVRRLLGTGRLVTLVGPGGAGKTRLAVETATALLSGGGMDDGVWLVELAPVTDPDDIAQAVLGSLTLREKRLLDTKAPSAPRDALGRLIEAFSGGPALLVLDNCEHLVEGAARVAEHLLGRCPDLRILATSREPLAILGESVFPVPPLGQPAPDATAEEALAFPAVRLLVDRATAVRPGFTVDHETVADVIEIVRRLDGLPLAIELAAARLRVLSVHQVADRLEDRFRLLTGGSRTAVPRHQTLRAVVAWSWDLLTDDERRLAEQLAVFPGGATLDAVQQVCGGDDDVLDLLTALSDKSLVQTLTDGEPRYRMLETIREYGVERLAERAAVADVRRAHAAYYLALAEAAEPKLRGRDQIAWIDRLGHERDNLLSALRFAADTGDAVTAIRFGAALGWYWSLLGSHAEAHAWLGLALSVPGELGPEHREARQVVVLMHLLSGFGSGQPDADLATARRLSTTELAGIDGTRGHPMLALVAAGAAMLAEDPEQAQREIARNLAHPDPWARAALTLMRAALGENSGDVATLRRDGQSGYDQFAAIGDRWGMATCLSSLGWVRMIDGDLDGAIAAYERSIELVRELRAGDDITEQLLRLGAVRARAGDLAGARRDVLLAQEQADRRHSAYSQAFIEFGLGDLCRQAGDLEAARAHFERASATLDSTAFGPPQVEAVVMTGIAALDLAQGFTDTGHARLQEALEKAFRVQDMPIAAMVLTGLARHAQALGDPARAATLLGAAVALRGAEDRSDRETAGLAAWARAALGPREHAAAYSRGLGMSREQARAFAEQTQPAAATQARRR